MDKYAIGIGLGDSRARRQDEYATGSLEAERIRHLMDAEIGTINNLLQAHQIRARTRRGLTMCVKSSFIAYGLELAKGEQIKRVAGVTGELSNALTLHRQRMGYGGRRWCGCGRITRLG